MKIAIFVPLDFDAWNYHKSLIKALCIQNHAVTIICPPGEYVPDLIQTLGVSHIPVEVGRFFDPTKDVRLFASLYRIFRREQFDIVHNHTIKPNIYGTLAARLAGVQTILATVHGIGSVFTAAPTLKRQLVKRIAINLFTLAFRFVDRVQFLNTDDLNFFISQGMVNCQKTVLIRGVGVDLDEFTINNIDPVCIAKLRSELGIEESQQIVTMVARAYWTKGVREFINAADALGSKHSVRFLLIGKTEDGPDAVPEEYLRQHESQSFHWLGWRTDVRELLALSDLVVLPSYREGIPRTLMEAMAMSKPIITTDAVGCKEVVDNGKNGFMVPVKDADALTRAIDLLLTDENKRIEFGKYSRRKVENEFDEKVIVNKVLSALFQLQIDSYATDQPIQPSSMHRDLRGSGLPPRHLPGASRDSSSQPT